MAHGQGHTRRRIRLADIVGRSARSRVARLAAVDVTAAAVVVVTAGPSLAAGPLRTVSGSRFIGFAGNASLLCNNTATCTSGSNSTYRAIANSEFNQVTRE